MRKKHRRKSLEKKKSLRVSERIETELNERKDDKKNTR